MVKKIQIHIHIHTQPYASRAEMHFCLLKALYRRCGASARISPERYYATLRAAHTRERIFIRNMMCADSLVSVRLRARLCGERERERVRMHERPERVKNLD